MRLVWGIGVVLGLACAQPSPTPQQTFEQTEARALLALSQLRDQRAEVGNAIKALEAEVGNLPTLIERMNRQLQGVRGDFARVRQGVSSPLRCLKRADIAYAINGGLAHAVTGNLAFSLRGDVGLALDAVQSVAEQLEAARRELDARLDQLHQQVNRLRLAVLTYPGGSERYSRLLAAAVEATSKAQAQIRLVNQKQADLLAASQNHRRVAEQIYLQGRQTLTQAKGWLEGLACTS
ncbi:MAG: hypothetical protein SFU83_24220 [Meiothermus sp.]|nr:hypothetical protein [Meiothermus sp.]